MRNVKELICGISLTIVLNEAAEKEAAKLSEQTAQWATVIGDVIQAPSDGFYEVIATSSLPTAAALAPAPPGAKPPADSL